MLTWKLEFFYNDDDKAPSRVAMIEAATVEGAAELTSLLMRSDEWRADMVPVGRCRRNFTPLD